MSPEKVALILPAIVQSAIERGSPLDALVRVMAELHSSVEAETGRFPATLSPWETPEPFVPMLERWVGLGPGIAVDEVHTRHLIERAAGLWRMRGTELGIVRLLELATGLTGYRVRAGEEPFALVLEAPAEARDQENRVRRIVHAMKPAAVRFGGIAYPSEGGEPG